MNHLEAVLGSASIFGIIADLVRSRGREAARVNG